jgi:hypothetical protein
VARDAETGAMNVFRGEAEPRRECGREHEHEHEHEREREREREHEHGLTRAGASM